MTLTTSPDSWRVLVIDDEPDNLYLAHEVLKFNNATVQTALGGRAGLDTLDEFSPNLILLDLAMPEIDGWQIHQEIRQRPEYDQVPVIALTALAMPQDEEQVREHGFDGYISKPFMVRAFMSSVSNFVSEFIAKHEHHRSIGNQNV